jgi:hypothetical protein
MCTGGRLLSDFTAGTDVRPDLAPRLDKHLTTTVDGRWVVWAYKLARPVGNMFVPLTDGASYPVDARARCRHHPRRHVFRHHAAPDPECTCGFHALSSQSAIDSMLGYYVRKRGADHNIVALTVALSGRVLAFEWAGSVVLWRAERQTVVRVGRPDPTEPTRGYLRRSAGPISETPRYPRYPGDPDGRPAAVIPAPPRDSGPIRLDLPVSPPVVRVCHDDAGWCAVSDGLPVGARLDSVQLRVPAAERHQVPVAAHLHSSRAS